MLDKIRSAVDRPARDATVKIRASGIERRESRTGLAVRASRLHTRMRAALVSTDRRPHDGRAHAQDPAEGHNRASSTTRYPTVVIVDRGALPAHALQAAQAASRRTDRRRRRSASRRRPGLYNIQNKAVNPAWHVPEQRLGGRPGRQGDPRRRSRRTRSRRAGSASTTAPGSTAPTRDGSIGTAASHGCIRMRDPGRDRALRPGPGRGPGLHRLAADRRDRRRAAGRRAISSIGTSSHPRSASRVWWSQWRSTSVPMNTPRSRLRMTANHIVRRVAAALDPVPRARGRGVLGGEARVDELALGGDLTAARVDEEHRHDAEDRRPEPPRPASRRRPVTPPRAPASRPRPTRPTQPRALARRPPALRRRPAPPRRGREDPPRLRHRRRPVRRLVRRARTSSPRRSPRATLRRYAATLSDRRLEPASVARKLAALRAFYRVLREHGTIAQNPADLVPSPKRPRTLPRVLRPDEMAARARPDPGVHAARAARPRAVRAGLLERPARRGARHARRRVASTSTPRRCASRARAPRPGSCPWASRAARAGALPGARAARAGRRATASGAVPVQVRAPPVDLRRAPPAARLDAPRRPSRAASRRTRCATRSPRICSRAGPICARSRSFSATHRSPRRRFTLG